MMLSALVHLLIVVVIEKAETQIGLLGDLGQSTTLNMNSRVVTNERFVLFLLCYPLPLKVEHSKEYIIYLKLFNEEKSQVRSPTFTNSHESL